MTDTRAALAALKELEAKATPGEWGRYGSPGELPQPQQGRFEAAPGLTIGSTAHTEEIARFSGYMHNVCANADLVCALRNAAPALIAAAEERDRLRAALAELMKWGVELDHPGIGYISVQVDRGAVADARAALLAGEEESDVGDA